MEVGMFLGDGRTPQNGTTKLYPGPAACYTTRRVGSGRPFRNPNPVSNNCAQPSAVSILRCACTVSKTVPR